MYGAPYRGLVALQTYRQGHGEKGSLKWKPTPEVVAALEEAFYLSFGAVTPTELREWYDGENTSRGGIWLVRHAEFSC